MVRGGVYVPNTAANAGVPTAPPIGLLDLLGASKQTVVLTAKNVSMARYRVQNDFPPPPYEQRSAQGNLVFRNDGTLEWNYSVGGDHALDPALSTQTFPGEWLPTGNVADFDVMVETISAGSIIPSGFSSGTWYNMALTRGFGFGCLYNQSLGVSGTWRMHIRPAGGGADLANELLTVTATTS
jgi:hypothetical protein